MVPQLVGAPSGALSLSLVVPACNEQDALVRWRSEWVDVLDGLVASGALSSWDAVVVDDGSTDQTRLVLERFIGDGMALTVVSHGRNRGLGAAVRSGLAAATGDLVLYTDADLPFAPRQTDQMLGLLAATDVDVVAGIRDNRRGEGPRRYVLSIAYNALVRALFRISIRDVNFAAKLIQRRALDGLQCRSEGSFIDAELIARLERRGATISQLELTYQPRTVGVSTLSSWPVVQKMLREMVRIGPSIRAELSAARRTHAAAPENPNVAP